MSTNAVRTHEGRLHDIAEKYEQLGYKVTVSPSAEKLPKFLSRFRPDLVAEGARESVVVEIQSPNRKRGSDYWAALSDVVKKHPGWRLDLVLNNSSESHYKTIDERLVRKRLEEGRSLAEQGMLAAGLLITWSAAEAAMRLASERAEIELPDLQPATVITRLYTDGVIEREEYDFLLESLRVRNKVAHGFEQKGIRAGSLTRLENISLRFLD